MVRRWLCYALALLGAIVLRVAYTGWLAGFLLWGVLLLPLIGLAVSLPGILSAKVELLPQPLRAERESSPCWQVRGTSPLGLPVGRVKVVVKTVNELNGLEYQSKKTWFFPGAGAAAELPAPAEHCGLLTGRLAQAWAVDCLGLFWLPLRRGKAAQMWIVPVPRDAGELSLPEEEEAPGVRPRPGGGPGEDYEPREYRPGDPLNTIHWKLSAKRDELVTRETLETVRPLPLLTLDAFGDPNALDAALELLFGAGQAFLAQGRAHSIAWADPLTGELRRFNIEGENDLNRCLEALLSQPAPLEGRSVLDLAGMGKSFHLRPGGGTA